MSAARIERGNLVLCVDEHDFWEYGFGVARPERYSRKGVIPCNTPTPLRELRSGGVPPQTKLSH